jgi:thiol-disulfide isomerase/thioredoxin
LAAGFVVVPVLAMLQAGASISAQQAHIRRSAPYGVVVVGADWCAPCREERGRRVELEKAAAPMPVRFVWLQTALAGRAVLNRLGGTMLPLAVAYDAAGRVCGRKQGLLGTDQLHDWARRCSQS